LPSLLFPYQLHGCSSFAPSHRQWNLCFPSLLFHQHGLLH
jgi:hypothetical protein